MDTKNPYSDLVKIMQTQGKKYNPPYIRIGQVTNPLPKIRIKLEDLQLDQDNLVMADALLDHGLRASMAVTTGSGETCGAAVGEHGSHYHSINEVGFAEGELCIKSCLKKGDRVALLPLENQQRYIVLCKVVSL
ncbi:DUF2577 domain-containing protein [Dehalobacter sp. DCM]|uniref:DUF2577 domain-containing protein n=1 Tax=Dehalobacter sp. DCM TaxID=2907827 RepID=UPI003081D9FE|nr:DUF2577 domain-containing protein [Dehalobacter sp. DCM]